MTLDQSLANLQAQADRLAGLFAAVADNIEAGHGTITVRKDAAGQISRTELVYEPATGEHTHYHSEGAAVELPGAEWRGEVADDIAPEPAPVTYADGTEVSATTPQGYHGPGYAPPPTPEPAFVQEPVGPPVPVAPAGNPFTTAAEPEPAKKKGRRTHEELAADAGVRLEDVKAWLGDKKVTKGAIEEYAALAAANAVGETPEQAAVTTPPDGSHLPQAPAPAPEWTTGPDGQPAPVYAPPAPQQAAAPAPQYPQAAANPFGAPQGAAPDFGAGAVPAPQQPAAPVAQQPAPQFSPFETQPYPAQ